MDLIKFSLNNPVKILVCVILAVLFGIIALMAVPIQLTPDIDRPLVTVRTTWPGRSPEEVEQSIILEQEKHLKTIQGLYKMTSFARLGEASINLEFQVGYNIDRAVQDVSNLLDEVPSYPDDVDRPVIRASSSESEEAIGIVRITTESPDPKFQIADFFDYADRYVKPRIERIPGVSQADVRGGREHEVQVRFDPNVLALNGITVEQLRNVLRADNVNESGGDIESGRLDMRFRILGRFESLEPLKQTIVKFDNGSPVYIEDIAHVEFVLAKQIFFSESNGMPNMTMMIQRETGKNVLTIMNAVKKELKALQDDGGLVKSYENDKHKIRFTLIHDDSTYINSAVGLVWENMYVGGFLAILILLLFLRSVRPTLVISLAIPISTIGTFIAMYVLGRNLNVISLAGLTFAIGMVVDNAIVVLENIDRHLHLGKTPLKASYDGTKEVWGAILSSTLTTVVVFAPVLTIQEETGQLFYDIALAISAAVSISLIVAITVVPMLARFFLKETTKKRNPMTRWTKSLFGIAPFFSRLGDFYSKFIFWLIQRNVAAFWLRGIIVAVIAAVSCFLCYTMKPPASYLPSGNRNMVNGFMNLPPSYSLKENMLIGHRIMEILKPYRDAKTIEESSAQAKKDRLIDMRTGKPIEVVYPINQSSILLSPNFVFAMLTCKDEEHAQPLIHVLNYALNSIPGCRGMAQQTSLFGRRAGNANSVQIEISAFDNNRLRATAAALEKRLIAKFSQAAVRTNPSNYNLSGPEIQVVVNQVRAKELGISVSEIAAAGRAMIDGMHVGDFNHEGDNIDLNIIRDPDIPLTPDEVGALPIAIIDSDGRVMTLPLSDVVAFIPANASQQIRRLEQERCIQLTVTPAENVALEAAQAEMFKVIDECRQAGEMGSDVRAALAGNADKLSQTQAALLGKWTGVNLSSILSLITSRMFIALLITYLLMAACFEHFLYPLVIMFTVPLATVGGFLGLAWVHYLDPTQQLDTLSMLGFVILIGTVVNNAILLIAQSLNFMRGFGESEEDAIEPMTPQEAICESVRTRLRPIFMTTMTTVFGMLPLVLAPGAGSELYRSLGAVVVGGLSLATIFTLFVIPLLFSMVLDATSLLQIRSKK
ncbi:MAG: efflux RND transporter permease subunit [Planctomycetaceae bacterium]|jgi:HAE1 family hydrophobic/amphiphilic exporter-1|nr:efflux RND transporter permease subunit [Planctomycetaceae bacterium]